MNITITNPQASETYYKFSEILLNEWKKKSSKGIYIFFAIAFALIAYDLLNFNDCTISLNNGLLTGKIVNNEMRCLNLHLSLGTGLGLLYTAIVSLSSVRASKTKALLKNLKDCKLLYGNANKESITIDENGILKFTDLLRSEYKWGLPKYFFRFDHYVAVYTENMSLLCCVISLNLVDEHTRPEILTFLEKNLKEENIKQLSNYIL